MHERNGAGELALAVALTAVLVRFVDPVPAAVATALIVAVAAAGTGNIVGEWRPWRMPIVPVALSAVAAFAIAGIARLVDPVPWLAVVFAAGWAAVYLTVRLETIPEALVPRPDPTAPKTRVRPVQRAEYGIAKIVTEEVVVRTPELPPHPRPLSVRLAAIGLGFAAFVAAAGLVPGGLPAGGPGLVEPIGTKALLVYAGLSGLVAAVVGYRLAALVSPYRTDRIVRVVAFIQYGVIVAFGAGLFRSLSLPRLFVPALLTLVVYVVTALRDSTEPLSVNKRLLQELAVMGVAAMITLVWGLLAR